VADHGVFTTIDVPGGFPDSLIFDINDRGQIVGYFFDAGGYAMAFWLSAMPSNRLAGRWRTLC
jgi:hypothetical protein